MDIWEEQEKAGVISRMFEKCPEAKSYEPYDWCNLSDNICIRNTGNSDFDKPCDYYTDWLEERE